MFCLPFPAEPFSLKFVLHKDALFYWINLGNLKSVPLSFFIISKSASSFFKKQLSSEKFNPWKDETKESLHTHTHTLIRPNKLPQTLN